MRWRHAAQRAAPPRAERQFQPHLKARVVQPAVARLDKRMRRGVERIVAQEPERIGRKRPAVLRERDERAKHDLRGRVVQRVAGALFVPAQQRRRKPVVKINVGAGQAGEERRAVPLRERGGRPREAAAHVVPEQRVDIQTGHVTSIPVFDRAGERFFITVMYNL